MICCTALLVVEENFFLYFPRSRCTDLGRRKGILQLCGTLLNLNFENDKKALSVNND